MRTSEHDCEWEFPLWGSPHLLLALVGIFPAFSTRLMKRCWGCLKRCEQCGSKLTPTGGHKLCHAPISALPVQPVTTPSALTALAPIASTSTDASRTSTSALSHSVPTTTPPSQRSTLGSDLSSSAEKQSRPRGDRSSLAKKRKKKESDKGAKPSKEHRRKEHKKTHTLAEGTPTLTISQASAASASMVPHRAFFASPRH